MAFGATCGYGFASTRTSSCESPFPLVSFSEHRPPKRSSIYNHLNVGGTHNRQSAVRTSPLGLLPRNPRVLSISVVLSRTVPALNCWQPHGWTKFRLLLMKNGWLLGYKATGSRTPSRRRALRLACFPSSFFWLRYSASALLHPAYVVLPYPTSFRSNS